MYSVKREADEEIIKAVSARFNFGELCSSDKLYVLYENGEVLGAGVLRTGNGCAEICKAALPDGGIELYGLLIRAMLFSLKDGNTVIITASGNSEVYEPLGFKKNKNGKYEILSDKLNFKSNCVR